MSTDTVASTVADLIFIFKARAAIRHLDHNVWLLLFLLWLLSSPSREPDRKSSISSEVGSRLKHLDTTDLSCALEILLMNWSLLDSIFIVWTIDWICHSS